MQNQNQWIFLPKRIEVLVSDDDQEYQELAAMDIETIRATHQSREEIELIFDSIKTRYVKVIAHSIGTCPDWHKGADGKAWLFVDEVTVK